ncbi:28422_t:CDS:2, partial [Dentiscutata erythropus]
IPTKKDRNGNDISIMILSTKWQHHIGWDLIVKGEFIVTHNGKTITIPLSTRKESCNTFNTEKLQPNGLFRNKKKCVNCEKYDELEKRLIKTEEWLGMTLNAEVELRIFGCVSSIVSLLTFFDDIDPILIGCKLRRGRK